MDPIRLQQINEALNQDRNANAMVFNLEKKQLYSVLDAPQLPESQVETELLSMNNNNIKQMMTALNATHSMISSLLTSSLDSEEFVRSIARSSDIQPLIQLYSNIAIPFASPSATGQVRRQTLEGARSMIKPTSDIVYGLRRAIKGLVSAIGRGDTTPDLYPTLVFSFVRCVETLAFLRSF